MSIASWKEEFYSPISPKETNPIPLVLHSLKKWIGAIPSNLKKHKVKLHEAVLVDEETSEEFWFDSETCSLCVEYLDGGCVRCPLYQSRGGVRCDRLRVDELLSPFSVFVLKGNPFPMLVSLVGALQLVLKQEQEGTSED